MSFQVGDIVLVLSKLDGGKILKDHGNGEFDVERVDDKSVGLHDESDLRNLPYKGRIHTPGFYMIVKFGITQNGEVIELEEKRYYTKNGCRLNV